MLPILFFSIATIYASVGFGGGTSYLALLTIFDIEYLYIPIIALICNIIVVAGNCFNYVRAGNLNIKFLTPYFLGSIPLAYIGGTFQITKEFFQILLFFCLMISGVLLFLQANQYQLKNQIIKKIPFFMAIIIGAGIGLISGKVVFSGVAFSNGTPLKGVALSFDEGKTWKSAKFVGPNLGKFAWRQFQFEANLEKGNYTVASRATDEKRSQPKLRFENNEGYSHNGWLDHSVKITVA